MTALRNRWDSQFGKSTSRTILDVVAQLRVCRATIVDKCMIRRTGRKMLESEKTHIEMQFKCRLRKEGNKWIADRLPSDPNLDISDTDNDETFVRQRSPPADQTGWLEVPLGIEHGRHEVVTSLVHRNRNDPEQERKNRKRVMNPDRHEARSSVQEMSHLHTPTDETVPKRPRIDVGFSSDEEEHTNVTDCALVGALSLDVPSTSASLDRVAQADLESDPRIVQKSPASVSRENNSEGNADSPANEDLEDSCANKTVTESQELSVIPVEDALNAMLDARNSKK
ncbi:hypothetical protein QR680_016147 [Steinernema hermaphroditum]|uniref:Uncharacterized protein n=1 Tax=Steinernema hermaphroditum TaxID=289476 RepID=A0AA39HAG8_9BILA|nr:hypothetical protein QR680_016147 [Steinernema hermaphroditum]